MKKAISSAAIAIAMIIAPGYASAFSSKASDGSRELKKIKKEIQEIQAAYYRNKGGEVMGAHSDEKSYYVKVNTNLPVVSAKQLSRIRSSGKNAPSGSHTKSQFSQGGCDNSINRICSSH